jgi:hypothetical protein
VETSTKPGVVKGPHLEPVQPHPVVRVSFRKRAIANFAAADVARLVRIIKRKLKKTQYWPHLIDGCLAETGLTIERW